MATYPGNLREALGPYIFDWVEFIFAAADAGGAYGDVGDIASTIAAFETPFGGWVAAYSSNSPGNLSAAVFLVDIAGAPVAAATFTVNGVAVLTGQFAPTVAQFAAGDAIRVELDSVTTMDETVVRLLLVYDISDTTK